MTSGDDELAFPTTLQAVQRHWLTRHEVSRSTFYGWLRELRKMHPTVRWYGKRGRKTRVTNRDYERLEVAIWGADDPTLAASIYPKRRRRPQGCDD